MSRKDYRAFAEAIKRESDGAPLAVRAALRNVAVRMSRHFKADNAAFDHNRFMEACGLL